MSAFANAPFIVKSIIQCSFPVGRIVKVVQTLSVCGDGSEVKEVSDGEIFIKAHFSTEATTVINNHCATNKTSQTFARLNKYEVLLVQSHEMADMELVVAEATPIDCYPSLSFDNEPIPCCRHSRIQEFVRKHELHKILAECSGSTCRLTELMETMSQQTDTSLSDLADNNGDILCGTDPNHIPVLPAFVNILDYKNPDYDFQQSPAGDQTSLRDSVMLEANDRVNTQNLVPSTPNARGYPDGMSCRPLRRELLCDASVQVGDSINDHTAASQDYQVELVNQTHKSLIAESQGFNITQISEIQEEGNSLSVNVDSLDDYRKEIITGSIVESQGFSTSNTTSIPQASTTAAASDPPLNDDSVSSQDSYRTALPIISDENLSITENPTNPLSSPTPPTTEEICTTPKSRSSRKSVLYNIYQQVKTFWSADRKSRNRDPNDVSNLTASTNNTLIENDDCGSTLTHEHRVLVDNLEDSPRADRALMVDTVEDSSSTELTMEMVNLEDSPIVEDTVELANLEDFPRVEHNVELANVENSPSLEHNVEFVNLEDSPRVEHNVEFVNLEDSPRVERNVEFVNLEDSPRVEHNVEFVNLEDSPSMEQNVEHVTMENSLRTEHNVVVDNLEDTGNTEPVEALSNHTKTRCRERNLVHDDVDDTGNDTDDTELYVVDDNIVGIRNSEHNCLDDSIVDTATVHNCASTHRPKHALSPATTNINQSSSNRVVASHSRSTGGWLRKRVTLRSSNTFLSKPLPNKHNSEFINNENTPSTSKVNHTGNTEHNVLDDSIVDNDHSGIVHNRAITRRSQHAISAATARISQCNINQEAVSGSRSPGGLLRRRVPLQPSSPFFSASPPKKHRNSAFISNDNTSCTSKANHLTVELDTYYKNMCDKNSAQLPNNKISVSPSVNQSKKKIRPLNDEDIDDPRLLKWFYKYYDEDGNIRPYSSVKQSKRKRRPINDEEIDDDTLLNWFYENYDKDGNIRP